MSPKRQTTVINLYYNYFMEFADSHAHLNDSAFEGDRKEIIEQCFKAGVGTIAEIACEVQEWQPALDLSAAYEGKIFPVCGIHPDYASTLTDEKFKELETYLLKPQVKALGEIGLDYNEYDAQPKDRKIQQQAFAKQLDLAAKVNLPVVLHCRKSRQADDFSAYEDMFAILKNATFTGGIMHCFSGREKDAFRALDMGFKLGINGIIGYKRNDDLRAIIKKAGIKYLLLETDCPYLPPQSKRGQRNSPVNIPEIAQTIAEVCAEPLFKVAEITTQNTCNVYNLK